MRSERIWKSENVQIGQLNQMNANTIHTSLGIEFSAIGLNFIEARMPVDERTKNPPGILHGGASVVLAESLGSVASVLVAGEGSATCVGIEINASHLKSVKSGFVVGRVTPIRLGRTLHVWDIQIRDGSSTEVSLVCQCRLTVMVKSQSI
jgi:1,4-dihydroxy-2-naphthoyl-CoA hydrolase